MVLFSHLPLAATEAPGPLNLVITGFVFVILVLSLLALLTFLGGKFFASRTVEATVPTPSAPRAADVILQKAEADGRIAAVITAAVHIALQDHQFRVRSIRRSSPGWAQEGRRQIFSSHRVR